MDKRKVVTISALLDCQLRILSVLCSNNKSWSVQELASFVGRTDNLITTMLADLVGYGIVTAHFDECAQLRYHLTSFGQYFHDRILCKKDIDGQILPEENSI